ncbi:unnamed protein product [Linum trigynum]|uniref:Uncharacterized protein n=1 Tax=Linum trigynum TaxID=586398 RepID=A0AAV2DXW3_9ROSI
MSPGRLCFLVLIIIASSACTIYGGSDVDFQVINNSPTTKGGARFMHEVGLNYTRYKMAVASQFIWQNIFHQYKPCDRRNYQQVKLFINVFNASKVAYTGSGEIYFSANYLEKCPTRYIRREFTGIMYREMARVWQWNGGGQANPGLIDGIANYVRMKANLAPVGHSAKPRCGGRWDQGGDVTARFLDYCDSLRKGFVANLNMKMKYSYSDNYFQQLLGKSVNQIWRQYQKKYNRG